MRKKKAPKENSRVPGIAGVPPEVALPQMQLAGNREAVVEHCGGISEYDEFHVQLQYGKLTLQFTGRNLTLKSMTPESVVVSGFFTSISFL